MRDEEMYDIVKIYLEDILLLNGIPKKHSKLLFDIWIIKESSLKLILNDVVKKKLANKSEITIGTMNNIITKMIEKDLILKTSKRTYQLNPLIDNISRLSVEGCVEIKIIYQTDTKLLS